MNKDELKQLMSDNKLTGREVARICHVSENSAYKWRMGVRKMSPAHVALLKMHIEGMGDEHQTA